MIWCFRDVQMEKMVILGAECHLKGSGFVS